MSKGLQCREKDLDRRKGLQCREKDWVVVKVYSVVKDLGLSKFYSVGKERGGGEEIGNWNREEDISYTEEEGGGGLGTWGSYRQSIEERCIQKEKAKVVAAAWGT